MRPRSFEPLSSEAVESHFTIDPSWTVVESNAIRGRGPVEVFDRR